MADLSSDQRMAWWRAARFGMFIHWGLYSELAGEWRGRRARLDNTEWIMAEKMIFPRAYMRTAQRFNPVKFDADAWAQLALNAGMKYVVITAKHHEGFSMYHSKLTDYNIVDATPFGRDPMTELSEACRARGLRFGFYYSQLDWHRSLFPGGMTWTPRFREYLEFMKGQLEELLTNYGPVSVLFFDGDWMPQWTRAVGREVEAHCRALQPDVIINNRVGKRPLASTIMPLQPFVPPTGHGDYETPEQSVIRKPPPRDWETNMTMNKTWGFSRHDHNWKSTKELIRILCETASKGGNLLLNVGPTGQGEIPEPSVTRLREIGEWLKENRSQVYGPGAG